MSELSMEREMVLRKWVLAAAMSERPHSAALRAEEVGATSDDLKAVVKYLDEKGLIKRKYPGFILARGIDLSRLPDVLVEITSDGVDRVRGGEIVNSDDLLAEMPQEIIIRIEQAAKDSGLWGSLKQGAGNSLGEALIKTAPKLAYRFFSGWANSGDPQTAIVDAVSSGVE